MVQVAMPVVICCGCHQTYEVPASKLDLALTRDCPECGAPLMFDLTGDLVESEDERELDDDQELTGQAIVESSIQANSVASDSVNPSVAIDPKRSMLESSGLDLPAQKITVEPERKRPPQVGSETTSEKASVDAFATEMVVETVESLRSKQRAALAADSTKQASEPEKVEPTKNEAPKSVAASEKADGSSEVGTSSTVASKPIPSPRPKAVLPVAADPSVKLPVPQSEPVVRYSPATELKLTRAVVPIQIAEKAPRTRNVYGAAPPKLLDPSRRWNSENSRFGLSGPMLTVTATVGFLSLIAAIVMFGVFIQGLRRYQEDSIASQSSTNLEVAQLENDRSSDESAGEEAPSVLYLAPVAPPAGAGSAVPSFPNPQSPSFPTNGSPYTPRPNSSVPNSSPPNSARPTSLIGSPSMGFLKGDEYRYEIEVLDWDNNRPEEKFNIKWTLDLEVVDREASSPLIYATPTGLTYCKLAYTIVTYRREKLYDSSSPWKVSPESDPASGELYVSRFGVLEDPLSQGRSLPLIRIPGAAGLRDPLVVPFLPTPRRPSSTWFAFSGSEAPLAIEAATRSGVHSLDIVGPMLREVSFGVEKSTFRVLSETDAELKVERVCSNSEHMGMGQANGTATYRFDKTLGVVARVDYEGFIVLSALDVTLDRATKITARLVFPSSAASFE